MVVVPYLSISWHVTDISLRFEGYKRLLTLCSTIVAYTIET